MIIIEGPDNSGKSTLGTQLSDALGIPLRHSVRPAPEWSHRQCFEHSARQLRPQRAILDRVYAISENIYGPICRKENGLGDNAKKALMDLYHRPYLVIFCRPPVRDILANGEREQMEGVLENHHDLIRGYDRLMEDMVRFSLCTVIQYNWTDKTSLPELIDKCRDHVGRADQAHWSATHMVAV